MSSAPACYAMFVMAHSRIKFPKGRARMESDRRSRSIVYYIVDSMSVKVNWSRLPSLAITLMLHAHPYAIEGPVDI